MKNLYTKIIVTLSALTLLVAGSFISNVTSAANYFSMGGNTYECPGTADGYNAAHDVCYSWCFVEKTKVAMADGSEKNIEDVVKGDWLKGSNGPNKVQYVIRKFNDGKVYSFNGGRYFVTDSHPFKTTEGWKSINPEATKLGHPGVEVKKLEIGDVLITENGNVELKSIDGKNDPQEVYTFMVDGTHDYYADGYLVHNKYLGVGGVCPAGWFAPGGITYDWGYSVVPGDDPDACVLRDLGAPVLIGPSSTGGAMADVDIMGLTYWDKNKNDAYDNGTDRPLLVPSYAVNTNGNTGYPYTLAVPLYFTGAGFRWNNAVNLLYQGTYTFGVSQSSSAWVSLMNQGFTTNDPIVSSVAVGGGVGYITGLQIGLDFSCNGTGTQDVHFTEYTCPAGYIPSGTMCYTGSTVVGGPCTTNADCTSSGTCNGYVAPNSAFKYDDGLAWNASHPNWNDHPHGGAPAGYCRDGDDAIGCLPNDPNQNPNWYGGGYLCGCSNFIPNNNSTPGSCSTSSSNWISATENIITETVTCDGTGSSCVPSRTCSVGYALTGDTNGDGNPNCSKVTCTTTTGGTTLYDYSYDWTQPGPIGVSLSANEDGAAQNCAASYFIVTADIPGTLSSDVTVNFDATGPNGESCPGQTITIPGGSTSASINVTCGCAIANGGALNTNITSITPTYIDGMYFEQYFQFNTSTGLDISADILNCGCDSSIGDNCAQPTTTQLNNPNTFCFDTVRNYPSVPFYTYKIYAYSGSTVGGGGQTICSTDYEEATDANNCSGCVTTTETPAVCDINDPLMAGVCYIPGGFGTTMIVTNGMVGINTTNPGYALDIDGTIRAAEVLTLSDARLKSSIEKIDGALEKIRAINGYAFTWKDSGKPDLGVLAQEIEKVFADAVATDANGKKTVQYNALLAPVIEAIKELNTQIDSLYNEKFDNQVKRIEAIEKAVK